MKVFLIIAIILIVLVALFLLRSEYERHHVVTTYYTVRSKRLPSAFEGFRILYLSDFHAMNYRGQQKAFEKRLSRIRCDAILMGGDMVTVRNREKEFSAFENLLNHCPEGVPIFFSMGNHESRMYEGNPEYDGWSDEFDALLEKYHVRVLDNETIGITKDGAHIFLSGCTLEKKYYKPVKIEPLSVEEIEEKIGPNRGFSVVMVHSPLYMETFSEWGSDLTLSGHFHGGTIYLGPLGGLMTP